MIPQFPNYMQPPPVAVGYPPLVSGQAYNKKKEKKTRYELLEPSIIERTLYGHRITKNVTQSSLPLEGVPTVYPPQYFSYARPCMIDFIRENRSLKLQLDDIDLSIDIDTMKDDDAKKFATKIGLDGVNTRKELETKLKGNAKSAEMLEMIIDKVCKDILNRENRNPTIIFTRSVKVAKDDKKTKAVIEFNSLSCKLKFYAMVLGNFVNNFPGFMAVCGTIPAMGFGNLNCGVQLGEYVEKAVEKIKKTIKEAWHYYLKNGTPKNSSSGGSSLHELKQLSNDKNYRKEYFLNESQTYTYICDRILKDLCKTKNRNDIAIKSKLLDNYKKYYNAVKYLNKHYDKNLKQV